MERKHLYYLFYLAHNSKEIPLKVPKTIIKGFGFARPTLMHTQKGLLKFSSFEISNVRENFTSEVKFLAKQDKKTKKLSINQLVLHFSQADDAVYQEVLEDKSVKVNWRYPDKISGTVKSKHGSIYLESQMIIPAKLSESVSLISSLIESFYPNQRMLRLELFFVKDFNKNWNFISVNSYKLSEPHTPNKRKIKVPVFKTPKSQSIDYHIDKLTNKSKIRSLRHINFSKRIKSIEAKNIDPLDLKLLGLVASKIEEVKQKSEKNFEEMTNMVKTLKNIVAKSSPPLQTIAHQSVQFLLFKKSDKVPNIEKDSAIRRLIKNPQNKATSFMNYINESAKKLDELRNAGRHRPRTSYPFNN